MATAMPMTGLAAVRARPAVARASPPWRGPRLLLLGATFAASGTVWLASGASPPSVEADLARVLLFMAGLKLALAVLAVAVGLWRLSRPARGWRGIAYVGGPPLAVAGALLMLTLDHLGLAALGVHAGLLAVLAAALTDAQFFAGRTA
ncbi:hypothetical protein [Methylobacterium sp. Leaf118]|uniref:hypothetical protein n=1 Tax=Methylobacterium sp. Leaf118 TaxID=2876562 RepID=UPI001E605E2F|nr:hypothetical protein [Methylobacterium sp. Leaf118]